jgi:hypothetical protein
MRSSWIGDSSTSSVPRYLQIHFSECNDRKLLRRIRLPQGVRPYTASGSGSAKCFQERQISTGTDVSGAGLILRSSGFGGPAVAQRSSSHRSNPRESLTFTCAYPAGESQSGNSHGNRIRTEWTRQNLLLQACPPLCFSHRHTMRSAPSNDGCFP